MGWSKGKDNGFGNYRSERSDRGQKESLHGPNLDSKGYVRGNHVHFHKDGVTVTKGKNKYTIKKSH